MKRNTGTYKAFQVRWSSLEGQAEARKEIIASSSLLSVVRAAKNYVATEPEWVARKNVVVIPRVNGSKRWYVPAQYLKAYRRRVIASNPVHMIEVVWIPE